MCCFRSYACVDTLKSMTHITVCRTHTHATDKNQIHLSKIQRNACISDRIAMSMFVFSCLFMFTFHFIFVVVVVVAISFRWFFFSPFSLFKFDVATKFPYTYFIWLENKTSYLLLFILVTEWNVRKRDEICKARGRSCTRSE